MSNSPGQQAIGEVQRLGILAERDLAQGAGARTGTPPYLTIMSAIDPGQTALERHDPPAVERRSFDPGVLIVVPRVLCR